MTAQIATLPSTEITERSVSTQAMVFDPEVINGMMRMADMMAGARVTVPKHLANSPADCLAVIMQAAQFRMNPFALAQKTHLVNGTLGYEAQLVNAVVCNSGAIKGRFHYEYREEAKSGLECRVGAVLAGEKDITWGEWLSANSVQVKNSPLWKTNPRQQLGYLQVKNWARQYAPGAILGVYSVDELEPAPEIAMGPAPVIEPAPATSRTESVKAKLRKHEQQSPAPAVRLDEVLTAIANASDLEALKAAGKAAADLANGDDKTQAREAYAARKKALETGELSPYDRAVMMIADESTSDGLDEVMDWAKDCDMTDDERSQLAVIAERRLGEIGQAN